MTSRAALKIVIEMAESGRIVGWELSKLPAVRKEGRRRDLAIKTAEKLLKSLSFFKPTKKGK